MTTTPSNTYDLDVEHALGVHALMVRTRAFDEHCDALLKAGERLPHFHSGLGQEALSVAAVTALAPEDQLIYTHRGIGQLLAKGISMREVVCDLRMVHGGTNHGIGSIMHVNRPDLGVHGREGVFGTRFGIAVGLTLAARLRGADQVAMCFFGEAAGSRGALYEALNMAVLWSLPIVFVAENNGWSYTSRTEWLYPNARMTRVWRGFEIPVVELDGNDAGAVHAAAAEAVDRARGGHGPTVIEGITYRMDPHIWFDAATYQPGDEVRRWAAKDPIARSRAELLAAGCDARTLDEHAVQARDEVREAFAFAAAAPPPTWDDPTTEALR